VERRRKRNVVRHIVRDEGYHPNRFERGFRDRGGYRSQRRPRGGEPARNVLAMLQRIAVFRVMRAGLDRNVEPAEVETKRDYDHHSHRPRGDGYSCFLLDTQRQKPSLEYRQSVRLYRRTSFEVKRQKVAPAFLRLRSGQAGWLFSSLLKKLFYVVILSEAKDLLVMRINDLQILRCRRLLRMTALEEFFNKLLGFR